VLPDLNAGPVYHALRTALCGADIEGVEPDAELQALVGRFIDGHALIKRPLSAGEAEVPGGKNKVIYTRMFPWREELFWCSRL